jgi:hypothetical protein
MGTIGSRQEALSAVVALAARGDRETVMLVDAFVKACARMFDLRITGIAGPAADRSAEKRDAAERVRDAARTLRGRIPNAFWESAVDRLAHDPEDPVLGDLFCEIAKQSL